MTSGPDVDQEDLVSLVSRQAERYGDRVFMTDGDGETMSFAQLAHRIHAVAANLAADGLVPGQRVAIMMKNSLAYPVTWLGVLAAGGVAVPLNSRSGELDARFVLDHSGAVGVVVDPTTRQVAEAGAPAGVRCIGVSDLLQGWADAPAPASSRDGGTLANIQYTSGTTGFPKGCLLTHRYWQRMGAVTSELFGLTERDTMLTSQPHSYVDPQWHVVAALRSGAHLVLLDGFHPTTFMKEVARFGVTVFYCLGVMPTLLMKQPPAQHDSNAVERVFCSAIPVDQHAAIEERWGAPWYEVFGMTETGANIGVSALDHDRAVGTACLGRALRAQRGGGRGRGGPAGRTRRRGRAGPARARLHGGLPRGPGGHRALLPRRVGAHGRPLLDGRGRPDPLPRPPQGDDPARRGEHRTRAGGNRHRGAPVRGRVRRRARTRPRPR